MRFVFLGPVLCLQLPSDSASPRTPLLLANLYFCLRGSGLSPYSSCTCRAHQNKKPTDFSVGFACAKRRPTLTGGSPQLPSALKSLTSVFGMGTGVTSLPSSLHYFRLPIQLMSWNPLKESFFQNWINGSLNLCNKMWLSPRPISIRQLHASPHFHLEPIYLIVFQGSYLLA